MAHPKTYPAEIKSKEYLAATKTQFKLNLKAWITFSLGRAAGLAFGGLIYTPLVLFPYPIKAENVAMGIGIGALSGLITPLLSAYNSMEKYAQIVQEFPFQCEISETHWSFTDHEGLTTSIPFSKMTLEKTIPAAFIINCGTTQMPVYRRPLQEAKLEELFLSQLNAQNPDSK